MSDGERGLEGSVVHVVCDGRVINSGERTIRGFGLLYDWLSRFDWSSYVSKLRRCIRCVFGFTKRMFWGLLEFFLIPSDDWTFGNVFDRRGRMTSS